MAERNNLGSVMSKSGEEQERVVDGSKGKG
jgi:hypothetical protein